MNAPIKHPRPTLPKPSEGAMHYRYAFLRTDNSPEAATHNDLWLGPQTLGVEVTMLPLGTRCGLGNIDPQHKPDGKSSAAEESFDWPLPPHDSRIVTVREDKDSIAAMAVLMLRAQGLKNQINIHLLRLVGVLDRMNRQAAEADHLQVMVLKLRYESDAMNVIVKDKNLALLHKVKLVASILVGTMPEVNLAWYFHERQAQWREEQLRGGYDVEMDGDVAYIYAPREYEAARGWANPRFLVAVIQDPDRQTNSGGIQDRWTIVRQKKPERVFDRVGFQQAINAAEAQARGMTLGQLEAAGFLWGGPDNIVSSPQGDGNTTRLQKSQILRLAREHLESGVVS